MHMTVWIKNTATTTTIIFIKENRSLTLNVYIAESYFYTNEIRSATNQIKLLEYSKLTPFLIVHPIDHKLGLK